MRPLTYFAHAHEAEPGDWLVEFYDLPEAITQGDTLEEAQANASDALEAVLEGYLKRDRIVPAAAAMDPAAAGPGYEVFEVAVPPAIAARVLLAEAMRAQGVSKAGLARLMGKDEKVARRILAGESASLDLVLEALKAVGVRPALAA